MHYSRVHVESIGYELAPVVVSTAELENRLAPVYEALRMAPGQLELLTGISERRWWEPGYPLSAGAAAAGKKALAAADLSPSVIDRMVRTKSMELFRESSATLTGGSGAVAVLVVGKELSRERRRRLVGGVT